MRKVVVPFEDGPFYAQEVVHICVKFDDSLEVSRR